MSADQLALFVKAPTPEAFLGSLQRRGLRGVERILLTQNRSVVVSVVGGSPGGGVPVAVAELST
jgi:hypothetical protein